MTSPPQLGPFELSECIGRGGTARVYRGSHRDTGVDVAIKVVSRGDDRPHHKPFDREVQAQAGLLHPGIVYLFDYGTLGPETANAVDELTAGSPYVVMELAERGTVADGLSSIRWSTVRTMLAQILDALAFAHARGVIHRDLKPKNLLVFDEPAHDFQIKLADFGIAHPFDLETVRDAESMSTVSGTPHYMPPEQIRGRWRIYGPWTDLYALGCIAWELVCGRPPFEGGNALSVTIDHCNEDRPPLEPRFGVPDGLEAWIHRAMARSTKTRFRRAADALWALPTASDDHRATIDTPEQIPPADTPTWTGTLRWIVDDTPQSGDVGPPASAHKTGDSGQRIEPNPPPVPSTWRTDRANRLPAPLIGTGLNLFGLRTIPFVNRIDECNRIWELLGTVDQTRQLRVVLLTGDSGAGKSRLADKIATRAHELGASENLMAIHTEGGTSPTEGLSGMVQRAFHTWQMSRDDFHDHLLDHLPVIDSTDGLRTDDARALTEFVHPERACDEVNGPSYRFSTPRQKWALLTRLMARMAGERISLLWLDDLHWAPDTLDFVQYLVSLGDEAPPTFVIATIRSDILADRPALRQQIDELAAPARCSEISVAALEPDDHRQLIDCMLPLEPDVGDFVARRTEGNPLFAAQLLDHWIHGDAIDSADDVFDLRSGHTEEMPEGIHQLWMERLERLAEYFSDYDHVIRAVEMAAALGRDIDDEEWKTLCEHSAMNIPPSLVNRLVERGLASWHEDGWTFAHGLLVDSLARRAREAGRWSDHHRLCARMLQQMYPDALKKTAARRAAHLMKAGDWEEALEPMLREIERLDELGNYRQRRRIRKQRAKILDRLGIHAADRRRLENDLYRARHHYLRGDSDEAVDQMMSVLERARTVDDKFIMARAHQRLGRYLQRRDDVDTTHMHLRQARKLADEIGDDALQGIVERRIGWIWQMTGDSERAEPHFRRARQLCASAGEHHHELAARTGLGESQLGRGNLTRAKTIFERIREATEKSGERPLHYSSLAALGRIALRQGDHNRARYCQKQALRVAREMDNAADQCHARMHLVQIDVDAGKIDQARQVFSSLEPKLLELSKREYGEIVDCIHLALDCADGDWTAFDHRFESYRSGWPEDALLLPDHAWYLEKAGQFANEAGRTHRANDLWELSHNLWQQMDNPEAVQRVEDRLLDSRMDTN